MTKKQVFVILFGVCWLASIQCRRIGNVQCNTDDDIISTIQFCNDIPDCPDESDEITEFSSKHDVVSKKKTVNVKIRRKKKQIMPSCCNNAQNNVNKTCLTKRDNVCEDILICKENFTKCDLHCEGFYKCQDTGKCVSRDTLCDGNSCNGCPKEDHGWTNGIGFKCHRLGVDCILPQQLLWDGVADCDGGLDLCYESFIPPMYNASDFRQLTDSRFVPSRCFQCLHDVTIIPRSRVCDGVIDCPDLSDECLCTENSPQICKHIFTRIQEIEGQKVIVNSKNNSCQFGEVKCYNGSCIPRSEVCDGNVQCSYAEDESYSYCHGTMPCFWATTRDSYCRCKYQSALCRNTIATPCDGVDECFCGCGEPSGEDECGSRCFMENHVNVRRSIPQTPSSDVEYVACLPIYPRPQSCEVIHLNGTQSTLVLNDEIVCDGYADCPSEEDELFCSFRFPCPAKRGAMVSVSKNVTCNGVVDCDHGEDEFNDECNGRRFFCSSLGGKLVSINKRFVCDGLITCDNSDDERNCTDGRYYCENEEPLFVNGYKLFDGRVDCSDWSDECPSNFSLRQYDIFHSKYEMIGNGFLRVIVWIMGILALFGNAVVVTTVLTEIFNDRNKRIPANLRANQLFILNLALADILMGIFLLGIGISGLIMKGSYCLRDLQWRSGPTCTIFGVLSVLSSETSVATMILLTASRLYAVNKPFLCLSSPKRSKVFLAIILSWIFSFTLALVPLAPSLERYFIDQVTLPNNPFSQNLTATLPNARMLAENALAFDLSPNSSEPGITESLRSVDTSSWSGLERIFEDNTAHPHYYTFDEYFGYYSINSVCIPKFFVTTADNAWGFSLFVTLFNFFSFLFVASSYCWILVKASQNREIRSSSADNPRTKRIQRKILRLIITDLCCWMPICIIAFCKISGAYVSDTAYAVAAIVLLPINSALNPILYSDIPDKIQSFFTDKFTKISRTLSSVTPTEDSTVTTRTTSVI